MDRPGKGEEQDDVLREAHSSELAQVLSRLPLTGYLDEFNALPDEKAVDVFQYLDPEMQEEILRSVAFPRASQLLTALDPDDRARLLEQLPEDQAAEFLGYLDRREREMTSLLLGFPEESAGRIMTPEFLHLTSTMNAGEALARIRVGGASAATIYTLPVTDRELRLVGTVELKDLVLADPDSKIADLMDPTSRSAHVDDDQETVARLIQSTDVLAMPVVDSENRLVGLVTVDDAMDVLDLEETEDVAFTGATFPLGRSYFSASTFQVARTRVVWLLVLTLAATLTVTVLTAFEQTLQAVIGLALFIPLLIGTGGNSGAQSATTVVRALATSEIAGGDFLRVVLRETRTGLMLGGMLGLLGFSPVWMFAGFELALVVSLTLVAICCLASLVGAAMPLIASRLSLDPAVVSAPFVTTLVDALGLLIYFLIAGAVMGL
jgi:magnesium transporter